MASNRWSSGLVVLAVVAVFGMGCAPPRCDASNCSGCCDTANKCQEGTSASACGVSGATCQLCLGQVCAAGVCVAAGGGSGGTTGGGTGGGGGDEADAGQDAGPTGGGGGGGGSNQGLTVTGHGNYTFVTADGGRTVGPADFSRTTIGAWVSIDGGVEYRGGAGQTNGTFSIQDVPPGPYVLRIGGGLFATSARDVSCDYTIPGRADARPATINPTSINFSLTQLSPWDSRNWLSLTSFNAGQHELYGFERYSTSPPTAGVDNWAGTLNYFLYSDAYGSPMIESSKGDVAWLLQHTQTTSPNGYTGRTAVTRALEVTNLQMVDGQTQTVTGSLTPVSTQSISWDYRASDFTRAASELNAGATRYFQVRVFEGPVQWNTVNTAFTETTSWYAYEPELPATTVDLAKPFPSTWQGVAWSRYVVDASRALVGATPLRLVSELSRIEPLSQFVSQPIQPLLTAPRSPTINGADFFAENVNVGLTPTLRWTAPSMGSNVRYELEIRRLAVNNGQTSVAARFTAHTHETSFVVPPSLLLQGQPYVVTLTALSAPEQSLLSNGLPYHSASVVSGVFKP
ncbi:MAG: hypothetical protein ACOZQL_23895 [Myxococcota bacterium]